MGFVVGGVLPGRGSEETWMEAPVVSLISLIFTPSFPMMAPHWLLGTNRFRCRSSSSSPSPDLLPDSLRVMSLRSKKANIRLKEPDIPLLPLLKYLTDQRVRLQYNLSITPSHHNFTLKIESVGPSTVMILSWGLVPSILILAPDSSLC